MQGASKLASLLLLIALAAPSASFSLPSAPNAVGRTFGSHPLSAAAAASSGSSLLAASSPLSALRLANHHRSRAPALRVATMSGGAPTEKVLTVVVYVKVKPGTEDAFIAASLANAKASVQEEGIARFDVLRNNEEGNKFILVEIYKNDAAPAAHKETAHYATWRDTVADMMAEPRSAKKYSNVMPSAFAGFDVPAALMSGVDDKATDSLLAVHVFVSVKPGTEEAFKKASVDNHLNSIQEPGVARFDVLQDEADPKKFTLIEVYSNDAAPAAHKETAHYATWRDTVADMMAEPRTAIKYSNLFPTSDASWRSKL